MMCWESTNNFMEEEPQEEPEKVAKKPIEKTEKLKHEEEYVKPTQHKGNQLKNSIEEYSWERDDNGSTFEKEEPKQQQEVLTEFRQPIQVQSHLEMSGILVQLGRIQCT